MDTGKKVVGSGRGRKRSGFAQRDFAGGDDGLAAAASAKDQGALFIDTVDDPRDRVAPQSDADGLAGEHVVRLPKLAEGTRPGAFLELLPSV